ncbi:MAG: TetR-like C-terminal domain-containing protein [Lachnospiraceae bacterium]|nr:TetR-like C-terminal domain-containing protein [Lachnospiraceae bacterium]
MPKENQRVALSKHLLKTGLLNLLQKKHITKISISELCQEAEINRTTFYRHYETPNDVLIDIASDYIKEFRKFSSSLNTSHDMHNEIIQLCRFIYHNSDRAKLLIRNNTNDGITKIFQELCDDFVGTRKILYKGKPVDDDTLRLFNSFFSVGISTLISQWLIEDIPKTPEEIANLICCSLYRDFSFV